MKYNIHGFSQIVATKLDLTNDDLLILRWFVDFAGTNRMKTMIENDGIYYWIMYSKILEDLPILKVSKDRIKKKHFNKLCEVGVLKHKHIKQGGSFSYFALGDNYLSLIATTDGTSKITEGLDKKDLPPTSKITEGYVKNDGTKINLLNNYSITNNNKKKNKEKDFLSPLGEFKNVLLTGEELQKIKDKKLDSYIDDLSIYLENHPKKKYASHYATILNWYRNDKKKENNKPNVSNAYKREEVVPDWLNQEVKKNETSKDKLNEMEEVLSEFQDNDFETRKVALQERLKSKYGKGE